MSETYDYIIVGGGSSGCVLAYRLSADPSVSVLLIEAGGSHRHPFVQMPKGIGRILGNLDFIWPFMTTADEPFVRGKTLGGSSAVNGMMYVRGQQRDYDELAKVTSDDWAWDKIGEAYRQLENHELGAGETRGDSGPQRLSMPDIHDPLTDAAIAAGEAMGLRRLEDVNAPADIERVGYAPRTIYRGKRFTAADAFLEPVRGRKNLHVATGIKVARIRFEGKRAVGIEGSGPSGPVEYRAGREILLCAGAVASPAILQRSGVGPADHLRQFNVPLVHDSPHVGHNMREHRALVMQWRTRDGPSQNKQYRGLRLLANVARYYVDGKGPMGAGTYEAGAWFKTRPELDRPNGQFLIAPYTIDYDSPKMDVEKQGGMHICAYVLRPESNGSVLIRSSDPDELPEITPNYHDTEQDRREMIEVVRYAREFVSQPPLAGHIVEETRPGPQYQTDDEIIAAYDAMGNGAFHASGTCRMGKGEDSVLDTRLRVRGVEGLRVVDTSILPFLVAGNTNGPAMAMAWRAADLILEDAAAAAGKIAA